IDRADLLCAFHGWLREEDGDDAKLRGARWFVPKLRMACPQAILRPMKGRRYCSPTRRSNTGQSKRSTRARRGVATRARARRKKRSTNRGMPKSRCQIRSPRHRFEVVHMSEFNRPRWCTFRKEVHHQRPQNEERWCTFRKEVHHLRAMCTTEVHHLTCSKLFGMCSPPTPVVHF